MHNINNTLVYIQSKSITIYPVILNRVTISVCFFVQEPYPLKELNLERKYDQTKTYKQILHYQTSSFSSLERASTDKYLQQC